MLPDEFFCIKGHVLGLFGDDFGSKVWLRVLAFNKKSGTIHLETVMQHLTVLDYIDLLQHVALICYCSAPLEVDPC